jgi:uncharacterized protein (TIGR03437 family)
MTMTLKMAVGSTERMSFHRARRIAVIAFVGVLCFLLAAVAPQSPTDASVSAAVQCQYVVRPLTKSVAPQGGTGSLTIFAASNCSWAATSNAPWIDVVASNPGGVLGPGRLDYFVFPNTDANQRTGTLTVAGQTFTVTQAGGSPSACTASPITTGQLINGTLAPGDCESQLRIKDGTRPLADRYSFDGVAGQPIIISLNSADIDTYIYLLDGNGSIIAQNDDAAGASSRVPGNGAFLILPSTGKFTIEVTSFAGGAQGNYALNLGVPAGNCTFALSLSGQAYQTAGGANTVNVNTQPGCAWTASSNAAWIGIAAIGNGSGSGPVSYTVATNSGLARTGTLTVAGLTFTVTQSGTNGTACPSVSNVTPPSGAPGSLRTITGSNLTGVSSVRFATNVPAQFAVVGDSQIATTTPSGATNGPLTISKPTCSDIQTGSVTVEGLVTGVSAASYTGVQLAGESIVALFGVALAPDVAVAATVPLPTSLLGTSVKVKDSAGVERLAPLFFVSGGQINLQVPPGTATGLATLTVTNNLGTISSGSINVTRTGPGIFAANANGQGLAAAQIYRVRGDGTQGFEEITQYDPAQAKFVPIPIDLGPPTDQVFLILYGTGIRNRSALPAVAVNIDGAAASVGYAGPTPGFVGLDQLNVPLSRALIGRGVVTVTLVVDGNPANPLSVTIK